MKCAQRAQPLDAHWASTSPDSYEARFGTRIIRCYRYVAAPPEYQC